MSAFRVRNGLAFWRFYGVRGFKLGFILKFDHKYKEFKLTSLKYSKWG